MGSVGIEQPLDFYSSPYLAEHYDLICAQEGSFFKDIDVFFAELIKIRDRKRAIAQDPDELIVIDVGTGTGRALHSLAQRALQNDMNISKMTFLGFDLSQDMVDRAAETRDLTGAGQVEWVCASAVDLDAVVASRGFQGKVDLIMFADGGFLHLTTPEEGRKFLCGLESSLRPSVGRACVSVTSRESVEDLHYYDAEASKTAVVDYKSQKYPGLVYQNTLTEIKEEGAIGISTFQFEVWKVHDDGRREIVQSRATQLAGRWWSQKEMTDLIGGVPGIQLIEVAAPDHRQTFYTMGV
ncbi:hypothetical protein N7449_008966 [Penicillium cf. viridicatum]|uniref:Methyltransferase domain-containing protein n=1 Tax=Penicillium cf. viridicatum TaxID=2972119 RepID=A0A9W9J968_9EURO|nr:hypothetical protein N7449_008966 [Penicillium cf. viridicatum]